MDRHTLGPVFGLLIVLVSICLLAGFAASKSIVEVHNTFKYDVQLELKCNYNTIKKQFMYHKLYYLRGNSYVRISVPNNSDCQIWPKLR